MDEPQLTIEEPVLLRTLARPQDASISFHNVAHDKIAEITADGIMRFTVDASDDNAQAFIDCIEQCFGRRLSGIEVQRKE